MPILHKGSRAWHRARAALPKAENGIWLFDTETKQESFISFEDLRYTCKDIMEPANAQAVEDYLGKMHYSKDPTYNMKKGK